MTRSEEPTSFGALLRCHRIAAGLTQTELAERAGLSARGVSDLERAARKAPHPHTARQLAAALHLTDEEVSVLMVAARRDDASRFATASESAGTEASVAEESLPPARAPIAIHSMRRWPGFLAASAAGLVVVAVALAVVLLPRSADLAVAPTPVPTRAPAPTEAGQQLVVADTLSDPANGVFTRAQSGSTSADFSDGGSATYQWDYAYMYSAIVAHVLGPYPLNPDGAWFTASAALDQPLPHDFAVQVRGRATRSPEESALGLAFQSSSTQAYEFEVTPADQGYRLWLAQGQAPAEGRSTFILPPSQPNLLRLEIRGDTLRALVNGHELARAGPPGLSVRQGGNVSLLWAMTGPPSEGSSVEVRFAQFALYALP